MLYDVKVVAYTTSKIICISIGTREHSPIDFFYLIK